MSVIWIQNPPFRNPRDSYVAANTHPLIFAPLTCLNFYFLDFLLMSPHTASCCCKYFSLWLLWWLRRDLHLFAWTSNILQRAMWSYPTTKYTAFNNFAVYFQQIRIQKWIVRLQCVCSVLTRYPAASCFVPLCIPFTEGDRWQGCKMARQKATQKISSILFSGRLYRISYTVVFKDIGWTFGFIIYPVQLPWLSDFILTVVWLVKGTHWASGK